MNFFEILGIFFLAVIVLNVIIGVFAIKAAALNEEEPIKVVYSNSNELKAIAHN